MPDPRLDELISLYFRLRAAGTPADPADLARPCPELLPELVRQLAAFAQLRDPVDSLHTLPQAPPLQPVPPSPPGYEILGELGRGGMGVVYKARQVALQRVVALKMIVSGHYASPDLLARFQTEMLAVARLSHPAIVQIFEVGSFDDMPFYSFELCANSLDRRLAGTPLPGRDAAALVRTLADGLRAIHAANVVHRDLKPANVLLTDDGRPKITDFGLAKRLDMSDHTPAGAAVGTPGYMAPEQVVGVGVGPLADVYALGAILYECFTGRPPFKGETTADTLMQVVNDEPVPPRQLNPKVPRDLETICLKCLHKSPERRYESAAALADDLAQFLDGRPIRARPVSLVEWVWMRCRRNPGGAAVVAASVAAVTVAMLAIITVLYVNAIQEKRRADGLAKQAEAERDRAENRMLTVQYAFTLDQARNLIDARRYESARQLLDACPSDLRSWEHAHLQLRLIEGYAYDRSGHPDEAAESLALDRAGRLLTAGSRDGSVHLWDHKARRLLRSIKHSLDPVRAVALSPDGTHLVAVSWATTGGNLPSDENPATARVYDAEGRPTDADLGKLVTAVAFSPDGTRLVVGGADRVLRVFDFPALTLPRTIPTPRPVTALAFHPPRGQRLAVAAGSDVYLVHLDDDRDVPRVLRHQGDVRGMAFSSDGRYLACIDGTTNKVVVHDLASRTRKPREFSDGEREVLAVAFHRARPLLAYGHATDGYHAVDLETGRAYPPFAVAHRAAQAAVFLPDGTLAGAAKDGVVLFDPRQPGPGHTLTPPPSPGIRLLTAHPHRPHAYSPLDNSEVEAFQEGDEFEVVGRQSGLPLARFREVVVSPDGATRAERSATDPTAIHLFDAATGKLRELLRGHRTRVLSVAFSPDGGRLFSAALGEVKVWCTRTGIGLLTLKTDVPTPIRHLGLDEATGCLVCLGDRTDLFAGTRPAVPDDTRLSLLSLLRAEDAQEWSAAIDLIGQLAKTYPDRARPLERRRLRALAQSGREAELLDGLIAGTQRRPDDGTLGWWLDDNRPLGPDPQETLPLIDNALSRTPDSWPLRALRGWMRRQVGQSGVADLTAAARQTGDRADLLALAAAAELERGGDEQAAALLAPMRRTAPEPLARWHAERLAAATPRRAVWHLTQLLADSPDDANLHARLGSALARLGRFREAADHLGRAADAGHGLLTRCRQGEALLAAGDMAGYRRICSELTRRMPAKEDVPAVVRLCLLTPDAIPAADRLVRWSEVLRVPPELEVDLDPEAIEVVYQDERASPVLVAAALLRAGRPRDALHLLDRCKARDRTANWLRMIAHRRAGQGPQAAPPEGLHSPGSVIPRLGLVAGPLALPADLTPHYLWDDWRDVLPPPLSVELLLSTR